MNDGGNTEQQHRRTDNAALPVWLEGKTLNKITEQNNKDGLAVGAELKHSPV